MTKANCAPNRRFLQESHGVTSHKTIFLKRKLYSREDEGQNNPGEHCYSSEQGRHRYLSVVLSGHDIWQHCRSIDLLCVGHEYLDGLGTN
jgi:hypothetical protein